MVRVRGNSLFAGDPESAGLWRWLRESADSRHISYTELQQAEEAMLSSRHWMLTPFRELILGR